MQEVDTVLFDGPFGRFPDVSTEYGLDDMADGSNADLITIFIASTLNQAVTFQAFGSRQNSPQNLLGGKYDIAGSIAIAAGDSTTQHNALSIVKEDHAFRWYGATITTGATAPTAGRLSVIAAIREVPYAPASGQEGLGPVLVRMNEYLAEMAQTQQAMNAAIQELLGRPVTQPRRGLLPFLQEPR